ncbi:hypothetical protein HBO32_18355, partial [Pseudomonas nitroreducens]|uniref:hypothetical protein n=1 Tax=Pseudomonas nitroreducens TaxID=46680 RepID=UPI0014752E4B
GAVMITGIEDRLFKALSEHTHWKRKTASLELYAAPVAQAGQVPDGWRVMRCTSYAPRDGDKWEIYDPQGSCGVVSVHDVKDWAVRGLLDALAATPAQGGE